MIETFKKIVLFACICSASLAFGEASPRGISWPTLDDLLFSKEDAVRIRKEIKEDPVNLPKVQERLQQIASKVARENPDLINLVEIIQQDQSWYLQKYFLIKFLMQSKYFNAMNFEITASEHPSWLLFYTIDTVTVKGSMNVNGYDFLRAIVKKDVERSGISVDEYVEREFVPCLSKKFSFVFAYNLTSCILQYHAVKTANFSEFLVSVKKDLKKLEAAVHDEMKAGKGPAQYLTEYKFDICNAETWWWCKEYVRMKVQVAGKAAGISFGDMSVNMGVNEKSIDLELSITTRRELIDFAVSHFGDKVTNLDILKYLLLKNIERMSDDKLEAAAQDISLMARDTAEWIRQNTLVRQQGASGTPSFLAP